MRCTLPSLVLILCLSALASLAQDSNSPLQQPQFPQPPQSPMGVEQPTGGPSGIDRHLALELEKHEAKERTAALKNDTEKLLKLSEELKAYVDKSNGNVLSLDVIRKAAEIERLAKGVKDKMKGRS